MLATALCETRPAAVVAWAPAGITELLFGVLLVGCVPAEVWGAPTVTGKCWMTLKPPDDLFRALRGFGESEFGLLWDPPAFFEPWRVEAPPPSYFFVFLEASNGNITRCYLKNNN